MIVSFVDNTTDHLVQSHLVTREDRQQDYKEFEECREEEA